MTERDVVRIPLGEFKASARLRELRQEGGSAVVQVTPEMLPELRQDAEFRAAVASGLADIEAGRVVDGSVVKVWLTSWGTDHETTPPSPA